MIHKISAEHLSIERVGEIIYNGYKIELSDDAKQRIERCRNYLDEKIASNPEPVYGVTTGFGSLCNVSVSKDQLTQLQINLIKSHACGTGERVPNDIMDIQAVNLILCNDLLISSITEFILLFIVRVLLVLPATLFHWLIFVSHLSDLVK